MVLITSQNFGAAMADVVVDAMVAEKAREESAEYSGDLQSLSWLAMAFGGILGSVSGGLCLAVLKVKGIFLLFSIFPLLQLVSCIFIHEKSASQMAVANNEVLEGAQHITRDSPTADKQYNSSHGVSTNVTTTVWDGVGKAPVPIVVTRANDCSLL
jgi:MFS family permease